MKAVFYYFTSGSSSVPRLLIILSHRKKQRNPVGEKLSWEHADAIPKLSIQVWSTDVPNLRSLKFCQPNRFKLLRLNLTCKCKTIGKSSFARDIEYERSTWKKVTLTVGSLPNMGTEK